MYENPAQVGRIKAVAVVENGLLSVKILKHFWVIFRMIVYFFYRLKS